MMLFRDIISKLWQVFSYILVAYGYYLIFLFFYDTFLRVAKPVALPLALLATGFFLFVGAVIWMRDKLLNWVRR